jgi:SAM-dependent methyltransferase
MITQTNDTVQISRCEVCGSATLVDVLDLGPHPLCDDLIPVGDPRVSAEYPIRIGYCETCKTAHQMHQVPKRTLFPPSYHYRAKHTADVLKGMRQLVETCGAQLGDLTGLRVLDVGCNDGSLLSIFAEKGAVAFGVEPTDAAIDARAQGHTVYQEYLTPEFAEAFVSQHGHPSIITFTNVFAHIEDLASLLRSVRTLMSPSTLLVVENHYLGAVVERNQFDTFYHEHPRTYSVTSFQHIAKGLGAMLVGIDFPARYGGNIRVMMRLDMGGGASENPDLGPHIVREQTFGPDLKKMARLIPLWCSAKRKALDQLVNQYGPLPAKAFPGRAAILVKLLGLDERMIGSVYEKPGSMKLGHYVPGTRIPIRSDDEFAIRSATGAPVLNLAWHISSEIHSYLRKQGFAGPIVDILTPDEFNAGA